MLASKRQLAAILFADIVGYTALMQRNEQEASSILRHFQKQLEEKVETHNGKVVNFYGDGALCTFQIPIDAVRCAMALQSTFQNEPKTPVRIGIHSGTVTYEGDKIFGDSVNITSRIESMGVAGGILLSKKVRDEVKNNPDLQMQSLGRFEFKNVEEPMEVFALANQGFIVPKRSEIKGKLKLQKNKWIIPLVILGMLSIVFGFWKTTSNGIDAQGNTSNEPIATPISEEYRQKRVAVMVFDNKTGQENLADFGVMISDWITKGLMETGEAKIISAANITTQIKEAGTNTAELAKTTGVGVLLQGRYYLQENQLIIHANIVDAIKGEVIYALDPIQGQEDKMLSLLDELTQEVLGYWAIKGQKRFLANPPKYEAYQAYLKGDDFFSTDAKQAEKYFTQAFQLDNNFFVPLIQLLPVYNGTGQFEKFDSLLQFILPFKSNLTEWERLRVEYFQATGTGWAKTIGINQKLFELDPSEWKPFANALRGLNQINYPQKSLDYIKKTKKKFPLAHPMFSKKIIEHGIEANFLLNNYSAVLELVKNISSQRISGISAGIHLKSLIRSNQMEALDSVLAYYNNKEIYGYGRIHRRDLLLKMVCDDLYMLEKSTLLIKYTNQLRNWATNNSKGNELYQNLGYVHWYLGDYQQALNWWQKEQYSEKDLINKVFKHTRLGICYAQLNQREAAMAEIEKIQKLPEPGVIMDYIKHQVVASIQANLNLKEEAMESLRLAIQKGAGWLPGIIGNTAVFPFQNDLFAKPVFSYPPFEELVRPKG